MNVICPPLESQKLFNIILLVIKAKFNKIVPNFGSVVVFPIYWDFSALKIPTFVF